jgi:hypothetical protein
MGQNERMKELQRPGRPVPRVLTLHNLHKIIYCVGGYFLFCIPRYYSLGNDLMKSRTLGTHQCTLTSRFVPPTNTSIPHARPAGGSSLR